MHDGAGERAVAARLQRQVEVGQLGGAVEVGIDDNDSCAALASRLARQVQGMDMRRGRIESPEDHQVALRSLARVGAARRAETGLEGRTNGARADGLVLARIAEAVGQPVEAVTLDQAHGAGVTVGPDRFRTVTVGGVKEGRGDTVEGGLPVNRLEPPAPFRPDPA